MSVLEEEVGIHSGGQLMVDTIADDWGSGGDERLLHHLKKVEALVKRLLEGNDELFDLVTHEDGVQAEVSFSLTAKKLKEIVRDGCADRCSQLSAIGSHPYVESYHTAYQSFDLDRLDDCKPEEKVRRLNSAVEMIRRECRGEAMAQYMRKLNNAKKVRRRSASNLIAYLRERYARLEVLRVDLSYRQGKYVDLDDFRAAIDDVKRDWGRFRKDLVGGVAAPGVVGYLAKLEYGVLAGFHFHVVVLCDGSKHREDISLAMMLGEHWKNHVVPGREGRYYNCNRHKDNYRYLGIGTLQYYDEDKYSALMEMVVEYMVKTDFTIAAQVPGERTWFRSALKKAKSLRRRGRPRRVALQGT